MSPPDEFCSHDSKWAVTVFLLQITVFSGWKVIYFYQTFSIPLLHEFRYITTIMWLRGCMQAYSVSTVLCVECECIQLASSNFYYVWKTCMEGRI